MLTSSVSVCGSASWPGADGAEPSTTLLGGAERRRAPQAVRLALHVAERACADAGLDPATPASVFTSAHGDLEVVDALCRTLADDPRLLSPMRFHHSVHNVASGYWAIAARNRAPSTAVAAGAHSFAAGLLEALAQVAADAQPVLLVGIDTEAVGALRSVNRNRERLAVALVLAPAGRGRSMRWSLRALDGTALRGPQPAMAAAGPLLDALFDKASTQLVLALGGGTGLALTLDPA